MRLMQQELSLVKPTIEGISKNRNQSSYSQELTNKKGGFNREIISPMENVSGGRARLPGSRAAAWFLGRRARCVA